MINLEPAWECFNPDISRIACSDRGYNRPSGRPRVFLRQAQDRLTPRRTVQLRLGSNPLRLPGDTPFSAVSRRQFVKYPG
jgi:hypothetical protein